MKTWKRKFATLLFAFVIVLVGMPVTVMANPTHNHADGTWSKLTMNATGDKVVITAPNASTIELGTTTNGTTVGVILPEGNYYLDGDITLPLRIMNGDNNLLCLNGHKVECDKDCILVENNLTMEDCCGTGKVNSTGGTALIMGSSLDSPLVVINNGTYTASNSGILVEGGSVIINDGYFSGNRESSLYEMGIVNSANVTVNGGTFVGGQQGCIYLYDWGNNPCTLILNGGNFSGSEYGAYIKTSNGSSRIDINNTNISGTKTGIYYENENSNSGLEISDEANISGGDADFYLKDNGRIKLLAPLTRTQKYTVKMVDFFEDSVVGVITEGWSTQMSGASIEDYVIPGDSTYKIQTTASGELEFVPIMYTVAFDGNGGTGSMEMVETRGRYYLPENTFTAPEGKTFWAWSIDGTEYFAGTPIEVFANKTAVAVWHDEIPAPMPTPEPEPTPTPEPEPTPTPEPEPTPTPTPDEVPNYVPGGWPWNEFEANAMAQAETTDTTVVSPKTDDNYMSTLALVMMFLSGTGICVYSRRKLAK